MRIKFSEVDARTNDIWLASDDTQALKELSNMGIISEEDKDGKHELLIWDVEKVSELVDKRKEELTRSHQA